jgi:hypothetical protein
MVLTFLSRETKYEITSCEVLSTVLNEMVQEVSKLYELMKIIIESIVKYPTKISKLSNIPPPWNLWNVKIISLWNQLVYIKLLPTSVYSVCVVDVDVNYIWHLSTWLHDLWELLLGVRSGAEPGFQLRGDQDKKSDFSK